jgi:hypothetical protein
MPGLGSDYGHWLSEDHASPMESQAFVYQPTGG